VQLLDYEYFQISVLQNFVFRFADYVRVTCT